MSQVQNNAQVRQVVDGRPRQVLAISDVKIVAFKFTDSEGKVDVGLGLIFGTSEDGYPHISVIEPRLLKEGLSIPQTHIRDGIRALLGTPLVSVDLPMTQIENDNGAMSLGQAG